MSTLLMLEAYKNLYEKRSYTAAAREMRISQPYLSKLIKSLEDEYDLELMSRIDSVLTPTNAGERLYDGACFILAEYHRMDREIHLMSMSRKEHISVGITYNAVSANLLEALGRYIAANPDIDVGIVEVQPEQFKDYLDRYKIDVAIGWYKNRGQRDYDIFPLTAGRWVLCLNKNHPYARFDKVTWADLKNCEMILSSDDNHRMEMINLMRKNGFNPKVKHYVSFFYNVLDMINMNLGMAPLPSSINLDAFPNIIAIPIVPDVPCNFSIAARKGESEPLITQFINDYTNLF